MTGSGSNQRPVASLAISSPADTLHSLQETVQLSVSATDAEGNPIASPALTWTSSDSAVASVGSAGLVTALLDGTTTITVSTAAVHAQTTITVQQKAVKLGFLTQPSSGGLAGATITPVLQVAVEDSLGHTVHDATASVTLALDSTGSAGTLSGTATATTVGGVASFDGLSVDLSGHDYRLMASAPSLAAGTSAPFDVLVPFMSISVGGAHTCGLTSDGTAYCWGDNSSGRLGDGTMVLRPVPVRVAGHLAFTSISTGSPHSCALTAAGAAYCWGDNGVGELGVGAGVFNSVSPLAVSGGITFASIVANWHTCALTAAGTAYCWGDGGYALGEGSTPGNAMVTEPTQVRGNFSFISITNGSSFTCGLTAGGDAYCAGNNPHGELGDGSTATTDTMVAVTGGLRFASIAAGNEFVCGTTTNGAAWCWGRNEVGQLGTQTSGEWSAVPVQVSGGHVFTSLTTGGMHACGIATDLETYCWGGGGYGELGDGSSHVSSTPVRVAGGHEFVSIDAGPYHTCGITRDGFGYCWGYNGDGELGTGEIDTSSAVPVLVAASGP